MAQNTQLMRRGSQARFDTQAPIALGIQAGIGVETLVTVHQLAQGRFVRCSGSLIG